MSPVPDGSLYATLARLPDCREARGKVYPLPALLTMTVAAILCGCRTLTAVAQWGARLQPPARAPRVHQEARRPVPVALLRRVVHRLRRPRRRRLRGRPAGVAPGRRGGRGRGHRRQAAPRVAGRRGPRRPPRQRLRLRRPVGARPGARRRHQRGQGGPHPAGPDPVGGRRGDRGRGLHPAGLLREGGRGRGRLLPPGQGQPAGPEGRHRDRVRAGFFPPAEREERRAADDLAERTNEGHGRVEYRRLRSSPRLRGYLDWPGLEQVCVLERVRKVGGAEQRETVFAITSLAPGEASASRLLALARGHWGIENRLHWVKDVVLGEDACRVRAGRGPEILSGLRNAALRLLRRNGLGNIASALRHLAAFPMKAVQLVTQGRITDL